MKFTLKFKTPGVFETLNSQGLDYYEIEHCKDFATKFVEYNEYITIEFDSEKGTARVIEC